MKQSTRALPWLVAASFLGVAFGCGEDAPVDPCGEPVYGGEATDEAWRSMVDAEEDVVDDPDAPGVTVPSAGQAFLAGDGPPRFSWSSALAVAPRPDAEMRLSRRERDEPSWLETLGELLVPSAHAHLPPISGDIYYLRIAGPGQECPIRAITTDLEWQVDEASWQGMIEAPQPLSLRIMSAYLTENRITEGPYEPAAISFTVQP